MYDGIDINIKKPVHQSKIFISDLSKGVQHNISMDGVQTVPYPCLPADGKVFSLVGHEKIFANFHPAPYLLFLPALAFHNKFVHRKNGNTCNKFTIYLHLSEEFTRTKYLWVSSVVFHDYHLDPIRRLCFVSLIDN